MESGLSEAIGRAQRGEPFPQFASDWDGLWSEQRGRLREILNTSGERRHRVGLCCEDAGSFVAAFLALCAEDVDVFLFNPGWGASERAEALRISEIDWLVEDGGVLELNSEGGECAVGVGFRLMAPTGGTGGRVKFAIHDWASLAAAVDGLRERFDGEALHGHCVLPLYHVSGFMQLVRAVLTGGTIVFGRLDSFGEDHSVLFAIEGGGRFLSLVATQLERLLTGDEAVRALRRYRAIFVGGGPCPENLRERALELRLPIAFSYGMTETAAQVATLMPEAFFDGNQSAGMALPHVAIEIIDEKTGERLKADEVGMIRIAGRSCFSGYWGGEALVGRSLMTTDRGRLDEAGFLHVLGRADRVIISGGEKIDLSAVEQEIEATGLVSEVVAFGVEDTEWGEALAVAYVLKDSRVTVDRLKQALSRRLARHRIPKIWRSLDRLPRNAAGKIIKAELLRH